MHALRRCPRRSSACRRPLPVRPGSRPYGIRVPLECCAVSPPRRARGSRTLGAVADNIARARTPRCPEGLGSGTTAVVVVGDGKVRRLHKCRTRIARPVARQLRAVGGVGAVEVAVAVDAVEVQVRAFERREKMLGAYHFVRSCYGGGARSRPACGSTEPRGTNAFIRARS